MKYYTFVSTRTYVDGVLLGFVIGIFVTMFAIVIYSNWDDYIYWLEEKKNLFWNKLKNLIMR